MAEPSSAAPYILLTNLSSLSTPEYVAGGTAKYHGRGAAVLRWGVSAEPAAFALAVRLCRDGRLMVLPCWSTSDDLSSNSAAMTMSSWIARFNSGDHT